MLPSISSLELEENWTATISPLRPILLSSDSKKSSGRGNFKSASNVYLSERVFRTSRGGSMKQIRVHKGRRPR